MTIDGMASPLYTDTMLCWSLPIDMYCISFSRGFWAVGSVDRLVAPTGWKCDELDVCEPEGHHLVKISPVALRLSAVGSSQIGRKETTCELR